MHPAKWRETIDPFELDYHHFRLTEILGYPHAGMMCFMQRESTSSRRQRYTSRWQGNRVRISEEKLTPS